MGCASSKHRKRCVHCRRGYSPVEIQRSHSVHHHPLQHSDDESSPMVDLSSSSLGSLKLYNLSFGPHDHKHLPDFCETEESRTREAKLLEAKVWSSMMNERIPKFIPKTPIVTPPGEPETINTWEMMDGLEEEDVISPQRSPNHLRSFSFDCEGAKSMLHVKPVWLMEEEGQFEDFDPEILSSFRKSLQQLPSDHPFHISIGDLGLNPEKEETLGKERVIVYFTSLRGIRKTYEDSCDVRVILKSLGVRVDERDVSMHSGFKHELKELLGGEFGITLPRVFAGRKYIGGAEEIRKLNEDGKLEKRFEDCEKLDEDGKECEGCGDVRFVPCETCSGSCKVYYECEDEDDESVKEEREFGFQKCPFCNENGLIRCPLCCD